MQKDETEKIGRLHDKPGSIASPELSKSLKVNDKILTNSSEDSEVEPSNESSLEKLLSATPALTDSVGPSSHSSPSASSDETSQSVCEPRPKVPSHNALPLNVVASKVSQHSHPLSQSNNTGSNVDSTVCSPAAPVEPCRESDVERSRPTFNHVVETRGVIRASLAGSRSSSTANRNSSNGDVGPLTTPQFGKQISEEVPPTMGDRAQSTSKQPLWDRSMNGSSSFPDLASVHNAAGEIMHCISLCTLIDTPESAFSARTNKVLI